MLFDRECERLLLSDSPNVTAVYLWSDSASNKAARLGRALRENSHVKQLRLLLSRFGETEDFGGILQFIQNSTTLADVRLYGVGVATMSLFVQAISDNPTIRICNLSRSQISASDLALLMATSTMQSLILSFNTLERGSFATDVLAAEHLATAFASNTTLLQLEFNHLVAPAAFLPAIFRSLRAHPTLIKLSFTTTPSVTPLSVAVASSIGNLLKYSTGPLKEVEFCRIQWDECAFRHIANGLKNTNTVSKLSLQHCYFDEASSLLVPSLFQSEFSLDTLALVSSAEEMDVVGKLAAGCPRGLKILDLRSQTAWGAHGTAFKAVVDAFSQISSGVETVRFGLLSPALCKFLIAGLPTFRSLREIGFVMDDISLKLKDELLSAFARNSSLTNLEFVCASVWDETEGLKLRWCAQRNATLPTLLLTVAASQKGTARSTLLPRLLELSLQSTAAVGPTDVFNTLTAFADRIHTNETEEEESLSSPSASSLRRVVAAEEDEPLRKKQKR